MSGTNRSVMAHKYVLPNTNTKMYLYLSIDKLNEIYSRVN